MTVNTYGIREVADLTFFDMTTNKPFLHIPYALTNTNEHTAQVTYARGGKNNAKRLAFDSNRDSKLKITTQLFDFRIISMLAGADVISGSANIFKREELSIVDNTGNKEITLTKTPLTDSITVFPSANDGNAGEELVKTTDYTVSGDVLTITKAGVNDGDKFVIYYQFSSDESAEKISFKTNKFPVTCKIVGDTLIKNEATNQDEPFQMVVYKAKPLADFNLNMASEGDPATLELTFELMSDGSNNFIDYIKY